MREISDKLQQLENLTGTAYHSRSFIDIPKGVVSYVKTHEKKLSYLRNPTVIKNLSYHLELNDLLRWFLYSFGLYGVLKGMVIKIAISNYGNIISATLLTMARWFNSEIKGPNRACTELVKQNIISVEMKKELLGIYKIRNKQHLDMKKESEYGIYEMVDYKTVEDIWSKFVTRLKMMEKNGLIPKIE